MDIYATTKNTGPSYSSDPLTLMYLGVSEQEALNAVPENFKKYEKQREDMGGHAWHWVDRFPHGYTALPKNCNFEIIRYYMTDGWWWTVAKFKLTQED